MFRTTICALAFTALAALPAQAQDLPLSGPSIDISETSAPSVDQTTSVDLGLTDGQASEIAKIIAGTNVQPAATDLDVAVGVAIPSTITLSPLPVEVTSLVPGLNGYLFFVLADGRIVLVSPNTLEVVLVIYG